MMIMMQEILSWGLDTAYSSPFLMIGLIIGAPLMLLQVATSAARKRHRRQWITRAIDVDIEILPKDIVMLQDPQYEDDIYVRLNELHQQQAMTIEEMLTSKHRVIRILGKKLCSKQLKDG